MSSRLTKDARGFVDGVVSMLENSSKTNAVAGKVQTLLGKMTTQSKRERLAIVETSVALEPEEAQALQRSLKRLFDREVNLDITVEAKLLGGLKVQVGDWVLDTTLYGQLHAMAEHIMEEHV